MEPNINKHGLTRPLPAPVAREVRRRCGFGCVICGNALYQYDHLNPPFAECTEHRAEGIVLLCGGCHDLKTRRRLSPEKLQRAADNPKCLEAGFSWGPFDVGTNHPTVRIGNVEAVEMRCIISIHGDDVFSISGPEEEGGPYRINASLRNLNGDEILSIVDNEWRTSIDSWDVETIGPRLKIRSGHGAIALVIRTEPPDLLIIERLNMTHRGVHLQCHENGSVEFLNGGIHQHTTGARFEGGDTAIAFAHNTIQMGRGPMRSGSIAQMTVNIGPR